MLQSECQCNHADHKNIPLHVHAKMDPTKTLTLRRSFDAQMYKRFRLLKGLINRIVVKMDGFGIKSNRVFNFPRSADKVAAFMEWLKMMERQHILDVEEGLPLSLAAEKSWTRVYVDSAYRKGIARAAQEMRGAGASVSEEWVKGSFFRPIHADRIGLLYTRTYSDLKGITQTMDSQISRVLAQSLAEGRGPFDIAKRINDRIDRVGLTRARALARTEVVRAHAEATLNSYEEAGIEGVDLQAEIITAANPCPICRQLERRNPYPLSEARGLLPAHPNCRCTFVPLVKEPGKIRL